ncbi:MAG: phytoene desaturase family protein [Cytophagales bacterium]
MSKKKIIVIGSGFSGLSAACFLAKDGCEVVILEKNASIGGRARKFEQDGFVFDMGPSWYWMPDVFERFFNQFGKKAADFYSLLRLSPSYRVYFGANEFWDIPSSLEELYRLFEQEEQGSALRLKTFLKEAEYKYEKGINKFVQLPGKSIFEYFDGEVLGAVLKMHLLTDMASYVRKYFKSPKIISLLEFPVLFLGETPGRTPALYSLMNYADMALGTWYPQGGMYNIVAAMETIARDLGVKIITNAEVTTIDIKNNRAKTVFSRAGNFDCDAVVGSADYHHLDSQIIPPKYQQYDAKYWESRKMAPSSLLYYIGLNKKIPQLLHHNLFFDTDFGKHAFEIYDKPQWPTDPLFYVSVPSKTDASVAPEGFENLFILIPTAPGLVDTDAVQEQYFGTVMERLEKIAGVTFRENIVYRRNFASRDFSKDYHAHKGNAYGLANTLLQTGPLKPSMHHKKIKNLLFTGQLTVPGPGVPPSIISGEVVAREMMKLLSKQ